MRCALCKRTILTGETQWDSSIYGSKHMLCEGCGQSEETAIERAGSNDLPTWLELYGTPNLEGDEP